MSAKKSIFIVSLVVLVTSTNQAIADITMTFEEFLGHNGTPIGMYYRGIRFESASNGQDWIASDVTTGLYNASSWPSGQQWRDGYYWMYDYVCAWTGYVGDNGKISFGNQGVISVELGYCAGGQLFLTAYDSDGNQIGSVSGPANRRYFEGNESGPSTLRVGAPCGKYISYVLIHNTGDFWIVDNITLSKPIIKVDDVNDGNCVVPGDEINYTIHYSYLGDSNCPDINDVNIIDYLPTEVDFNSASGGGNYDPYSNTVIWNIGTLHPGDSGSVTLTVNVGCAEAGGTIRNECEIRSGGVPYSTTYEDTLVCCPTLTKVDDITGCVGPGDDINYSICYAANGYGDTNVEITDNLPDEVNYISSDPCGTYHPENHTVTWNIDFPPDACGCIELIVQVNTLAGSGGIIANRYELRGDCIDVDVYEGTPVCCWKSVPVIYVDANANGYSNGTSWEDAYTYLQDALLAAHNCDCNEILVAKGIYRPDQNSVCPDGTGDRTATFQLIYGVTIKGGYAGVGEPDPDVRDIRKYETILSGDLLGNDGEGIDVSKLLTDPCRADNSYHVVTASNTNATAVLDGFTITAGNANVPGSPYYYASGGGMYIYNGGATVKNCIFKRNSAEYGGGMRNYNTGAVNVTNCVFVGNRADTGGGMFNDYDAGVATVTNCTVVGNDGGGIFIANCDYLLVTNCILWDNEGEQISSCGPVVTYSDIAGGYEGVGNINKDPMFEPDGYHLTLCSPCIDAGTNTPPSGLSAKDIDGEDRVMDGDCNGVAFVDMGADEYYLEDCNVLLYAHCPSPACGGVGALDVNKPLAWDVNLTWCAGRFAAYVDSHDVYFGTDYSEVNNATRSDQEYKGPQSTTTYIARNLLLWQTYFWRIDEVNEAGPEPNLWRGPVWAFTTGLFIDDFSVQSMGVVPQGQPSWPWRVAKAGNASSQCSGNAASYNGATLPLVTTPGLSWDSVAKTMIYDYDNDWAATGHDGFAEARLDYGTAGCDWTAGNPKILSISYLGRAENDADPVNDRMYVMLEDNAGHQGKIAHNPDADAQQRTTWQEWQIKLSDLGSPNEVVVEMNSIRYMRLGFGDRCNIMADCGEDCPRGGSGRVIFDNIRLKQCALSANLVCDDIVNLYDFDVFARDWLHCGKADLYPDCIVDFRDFALLAQQWLEEEP